MKQSIGSTFLLNFIVIFIILMFAFLLAIMSYMKAFKINSGISNAIENNEGYNSLAQTDITRFLTGFGYRIDRAGSRTCPRKNGQNAIQVQGFRYCIYEYPTNREGYFKYGIITYIYFDIPIINQVAALPVYTETEKIYEFKVR